MRNAHVPSDHYEWTTTHTRICYQSSERCLCFPRRYNRVSVVVVGQPLADRSDWRQLTELFLLEFPEAWFSYINADYAELLHDMGLYINAGGAEPFLQVGVPPPFAVLLQRPSRSTIQDL